MIKDRTKWFIRKLSFDKTGCWVWTGTINHDGYGQFSIKGKTKRAHRFSYEMFIGPIPDGLTIDHLCRNRACVNPVHLEPVTIGENVLRGETVAAKHASKTHCPKGHEYSDSNTHINQRGGRICKTCSRNRYRDYAAKNPRNEYYKEWHRNNPHK